jgi:hypothetical protein
VAYCSAIPVEVDQVVVNPVEATEDLGAPVVRPKRQFLAGLLIGKALGAGYGYGLGRSAYYGGYGGYGYHGYHGRPYGYGYGYALITLNLFDLKMN